jgi:imidazolonepropionase-like amidohydrolase
LVNTDSAQKLDVVLELVQLAKILAPKSETAMINRIIHRSLAGALQPVSIILASLILLTACAADTDAPAASLDSEAAREEVAAIQENPTTEVPAATDSVEEPSPRPSETSEPAAEPTEAPQETLVLHNGLLITATGEDPISDGVVVIEGGLITAVGPKESISIPGDATMVDASGGTILPGIIDAHTHVLNELRVENGELNSVDRALYLARPLQAGVTTVRDVGWSWDLSEDMSVLRAAVEREGNTVPTIVMTGPILGAPGGRAVTEFPQYSLAVEDAEDAQEATERLLSEGVQQIKLMSESGPQNSYTPLTAEQVLVITDAAHAQGSRVTIHASINDAVMAIGNGVDQLAHWPIGPEGQEVPQVLPDELLEQLIAGQIPVVTTFNITRPAEGDVRRFLDAGGTLVYGSDGPAGGAIDRPFREMRTMSINGMTPMEIILAATANAAEALGLGDQVGTLEVGKTADIIIVDRNPIEDLRGLRDGIVVVIKGGELVPLDS